MICSNCGIENEVGRKFCKSCGVRLAVGCPSCGGANVADARFCGECGTSLAGAAAVPAGPVAAAPGPATGHPSSAPVAERRLVTVLFADLVGFTPFAEERDAEDVRDTLTRYFDIATDVVARYGGTIEKFIGDAVMAVWGAPTAREDDAERAVRAALELVDAVPALGASIQARAGVLTGEAAVTLGATNQGMVAGDLVNTAARLQSAAPPGTVLVGEATHRSASRAIAFEPAGDQTLKGKASPVPAWRALRVVAEVGGRNRSEGLEAPFVGRDEEFRLLKDLFHATGRERRTRLVSVIGPAGIGKSRLAWEFLKYIDGLLETVWWHSGRSPAYGEGITFWALGEMVRGRCGLVETDDEPTTRAKVAEALALHVPDPAERAWITPALLALLGLESGIGADRLFGAWRTFFERLAVTAPVVMVFEDLQWADSGLVDFIDHLLEWSKAAPIYVVTLSRPELLERRPDWGAAKRSFTSIHLEPLLESAMRQLLAGLVPGLPASTVAAIIGRADGIPLYAVETVRMLVAEGRLSEVDGRYVPTGDLSSLAVPETLTALISARLDSLDPDSRSLVGDAAVLGQSFAPDALAAVSGVDLVALEPRLRALVRRELLTHEVDPRSPERGQYTFVQALIREVAYNTLAKRDRRSRHLAAARYFEALGSEELAGALAGHYLAAHGNAAEGPEADALASQARIALVAAAGRAAALGAHDQVVSFLDQALTVTNDPREEADLLERAATAAIEAGRYALAEARVRRAIELRTALDDRAGSMRAIARLGRLITTTGHALEAIDLMRSALDGVPADSLDPEVADLCAALARAYARQSDQAQTMAWADRALAAAERHELVDIVADAIEAKATALNMLNRRFESIILSDGVARFAEAHGLTSRALAARLLFAFSIWDDEPATALAAFRSGLDVATRIGDRYWWVRYVDALASISFMLGDWQVALGLLNDALAGDLEPPDRFRLGTDLVIFRIYLGEPVDRDLAELKSYIATSSDALAAATMVWLDAQIALFAGRYVEAHEAAEHSVARVEGFASQGHPTAARAALWAGDVERATRVAETYEASLTHGRQADADRTTIRAGIAALEGRVVDSLAGYRDAIGRYRDLGMTFEVARAAADMAIVLGVDEPEARAAALEARGIFAGLGARPYVERLDAILERAAAPQPVRREVSTADRTPTV